MTGQTGQWRVEYWRNTADGPAGELDFHALGCLNAPPSGLGSPGFRIGDRTLVQRDGVALYGDWYESRSIAFTVTFQNDGCPSCPGVRQKVAQVMRSWGRDCPTASLLLIADCTPETDTFPEDVLPDGEDRATLGPYLVRGRPREANIRWERSDLGIAHIDFRFDTEDHRIGIVQPDPGDGSITSETCVTLATSGASGVMENMGDLPACLDITYEGVLTTPVELTFIDSGVKMLRYSTVQSGETVTLNTCDNLAISTLFGSRDDQVYTGFGSSRTIEPGFNGDIVLSTGDINDTGTVTVCWTQDVIGI